MYKMQHWCFLHTCVQFHGRFNFIIVCMECMGVIQSTGAWLDAGRKELKRRKAGRWSCVNGRSRSVLPPPLTQTSCSVPINFLAQICTSRSTVDPRAFSRQRNCIVNYRHYRHVRHNRNKDFFFFSSLKMLFLQKSQTWETIVNCCSIVLSHPSNKPDLAL